MKTVFSFRALAAAVAIAAMSFAGINANAQESDTKEVAKAEPVAQAVASSTKVRPLSVSISLHSDTKLAGTLTDTTTLEMRTSFGSASIPLSEVAGIRFASADEATTTVVMLNGDSITGATDVKLVTVETEWGMATINGPNIGSILFVPGLSWNAQAGLNGKRWSLVNEKSSSASSTSSKTASTGSSATSTPNAASNGTSSTNPAPFPAANIPQPAPTFRGR
jgi:hypothetical protein